MKSPQTQAEVPEEYRVLADAIERHRAGLGVTRKKDKPTPRPDKLPALPKVDAETFLRLAPEDRQREAERQSQRWFTDTRREYQIAGWLDDETDAAIAARAKVHHRSLTGQDLPEETLRDPLSVLFRVSGIDEPAATTPASARPNGSYYANGQWCRGRDPRKRVPLDPIGPPMLRKAASVRH